MARKNEELYVVGVLMRDGKIKFVTSTDEHHTAYWKDGEEAMLFSKSWAKDMCIGFAWNGISAVPILKQDFITLRNPEAETEE